MQIKKLCLSVKFRGLNNTIRISLDKLLRNFFSKRLPLESNTKIKSFIKLGYIINFNNPQTLNEKIHHIKFNTNIIHLAPYADKYKVRTILENKNYQSYINDLYLAIDDPDQINFDELPKSFVMKPNHGSGMIEIVKDKTQTNQNNLKKLANKWLKMNYNEAVGGTEFHYDTIEPKIIFEKLLENKDGSPLLDYKFFCFNGKVEFIDVVENSKGIPLVYVFNKNWNQLPFATYNKYIKGNFQKPGKLEEMIHIAEDLSKEFDFVRIDLYLIDDEKIVFGEYTFFSGGGMSPFNPKKYDYMYGEKLKLNI